MIVSKMELDSEEPDVVTRMHKGYRLTHEQDFAVDLATGGGSLKIEAYAGAGKTSTLSAISDAMPARKGLYLAFNKTIQTEASLTFPRHVECRTAHSLAYRAVGYKYKHRLQRLSGTLLAEKYLKLQEGVYDLSLPMTGNLILDTLNRFTQSADEVVSRDHAPWFSLKSIDDLAARYAIVEAIVPLAQRTWSMMIDPKAEIPITHDAYLKLWGLSDPVINKDFILFDECQDANPVMLALVCSQKAQKVFVGDRYQQIYSWRGAINAMQDITTDNTCLISQSFRFGPPIAKVGNAILNNHLEAGVAIQGFDQISSRVEAIDCPDVILCRTNARMISTLIDRLNKGEKVAVVGGCKDLAILLKGAQTLMAGRRTLQRDLALFKTWREVMEFSETESGSDLAPMVRLINDHDIDALVNVLEHTDKVKENQADLILSTAHKSKGREWSSVKLENDFRHPGSQGYTDEESNLLYVAATRAIHQLDITECDAALKAIQQ